MCLESHRKRYHHEVVDYTIDDDGLHLQASCSPNQGVLPASTRDYDFSGIDVPVQDSVDDMADIYNMGAVSGDYANATLDQYGNPVGGGFDLAKDGAFKDFRLLIGCFYLGEGLPQDLRSLTLQELQKKGWEVEVVHEVDQFTSALRNQHTHVAWIISSDKFSGNEKDFVHEVSRFHESGRGLMIWGDNDPYFQHANKIICNLFGFKLIGNTPGGQELRLGDDPAESGYFGKHVICSGIERLHEGITICYPDRVPHGWNVFGTSSNGHPVLLAKEACNIKAGPGRVVVDNGFTKIMNSQWTTAGTPRYVSNCCAWLALRERFKGPMRGFNPMPRE